MSNHIDLQVANHAVAIATGGFVFSTFAGWLPPLVATLAGALAIVWYAIQIVESATFRTKIEGYRSRHRERRLARERARVVLSQARIAELEKH